MTETPSKPRRGWFRFSLRTLFVMTTLLGIALGWVAHSLSWIRERQQFLRERTPYLIIDPTFRDSHGHIPVKPNTATARAPRGLWFFGEKGVAWLIVTEPDDLEAAKRLFPEAEAQILGPKEFEASWIEAVK